MKVVGVTAFGIACICLALLPFGIVLGCYGWVKLLIFSGLIAGTGISWLLSFISGAIAKEIAES